jgi:hypothetical protein
MTIAELLAFAFAEIAKLVKSETVTEASDLVTAVAKIVDSVLDAQAGKVTPDEAQTEIELLMSAIAKNDAAADAALADKFAPKE